MAGGDMRKCLLCAAALAAFLLGGGSASAQNATVEGIVRDTSGAVLPGATVTAKNEETGLTRTAVADGVGQYHVRALPPGRYTLVVELSGFTTEARQGVVLIIEQTAALDFTLKPAALAETLTVTGESPIIDTSRSDV